jgi:HEAT repeat protein
MIDLAQDPSLREVVINEAMRMLNGDQWRGCEQACVVLTRLNHLPSGKRMVELLGHERGEVQVAAAWGLSKLKIPELLPAMLEHAQSVYEGFRSNQLSDTMPGKAMHMAHLFTAFGDQGYRPAEPLMREYLPKNHSLGLESRGAATWAIGLFYEGNLQPDLVSLFVGRLYDNGRNPDTDEVRNMAAIALGRMKAESALPDLRKFASQGMIPCYWAIEQMTGEPIPTPSEQVTVVDDWFLAPIRNQPE